MVSSDFIGLLAELIIPNGTELGIQIQQSFVSAKQI